MDKLVVYVEITLLSLIELYVLDCIHSITFLFTILATHLISSSSACPEVPVS